ncbi:recombinase family protein [uncultured Albimonas sp.]|jgi:putative DNA-invertase from lambdoid prophage Rac|uniref:recombinase family protein n=1 Tax=uncultured Albimonas sp. TaxID=1331701 RepID=UPI0030EE7456|tara:strand:- start:987 stop:1661 length:675 start_codon:yes stop_codon:yes gene_type:complete
MTVHGYARVSTIEQAEGGHSLATQRQTLEGFAISEGLALERMFTDRGVSGSKPLAERAAGGALLEALAPGDAVFCARLDRMFRSASDALTTLEALKARRVRLFLKDMGGDVTGTGVASLVFSILAAVAQFERERIAERIAESRARLREGGRYVGGRIPFGWRVEDGQDEEGRPARFLVEDPAGQAVVARMRALRAQGASLRAIQARLAEAETPAALATIARLVR